jgi:hypothetical protein
MGLYLRLDKDPQAELTADETAVMQRMMAIARKELERNWASKLAKTRKEKHR